MRRFLSRLGGRRGGAIRARRLRRDRAFRRRDAPDGVAGVIGDQKRARPVDGDADRPAMGLVALDEAGGDILDAGPFCSRRPRDNAARTGYYSCNDCGNSQVRNDLETVKAYKSRQKPTSEKKSPLPLVGEGLGEGAVGFLLRCLPPSTALKFAEKPTKADTRKPPPAGAVQAGNPETPGLGRLFAVYAAPPYCISRLYARRA